MGTSYLPSGLLDDTQKAIKYLDNAGMCGPLYQPGYVAEPQQYQPVVLDLMQALSAPLGEQNMQPERYLHAEYQCAPAAYSTYQMQRGEPAYPMQSGELMNIGSPECPTIGSQGHHFGTCKPCAFLYTKGCGNGSDCPFCHLC